MCHNNKLAVAIWIGSVSEPLNFIEINILELHTKNAIK